jgi:predicted ATPase
MSVQRFEVARFDRGEAALLIGAILGTSADPDLVDTVYARSNGNAFFSEELVAVREADAHLPQELRDVVLTQVVELGSETEELLRAASAAGGDRFSGSTLAAVMGIEVADVELRLRDAIDRQVVVRVTDGRLDAFMFRHALAREAIDGELLPGARSRLHARFAAEIQKEPGT